MAQDPKNLIRQARRGRGNARRRVNFRMPNVDPILQMEAEQKPSINPKSTKHQAVKTNTNIKTPRNLFGSSKLNLSRLKMGGTRSGTLRGTNVSKELDEYLASHNLVYESENGMTLYHSFDSYVIRRCMERPNHNSSHGMDYYVNLLATYNFDEQLYIDMMGPNKGNPNAYTIRGLIEDYVDYGKAHKFITEVVEEPIVEPDEEVRYTAEDLEDLPFDVGDLIRFLE